MKERLELVIKNVKRDLQKLSFEKERLEWELKNAPLQTINGKERLEKINKELADTKELYNRLYWVLEG